MKPDTVSPLAITSVAGLNPLWENDDKQNKHKKKKMDKVISFIYWKGLGDNTMNLLIIDQPGQQHVTVFCNINRKHLRKCNRVANERS